MPGGLMFPFLYSSPPTHLRKQHNDRHFVFTTYQPPLLYFRVIKSSFTGIKMFWCAVARKCTFIMQSTVYFFGQERNLIVWWYRWMCEWWSMGKVTQIKGIVLSD